MGYQEVPKLAQVVDKGVEVGLIDLMGAVGQHVPKEAVHQPKGGMETLVLGDEERNPLMGQVEPGILAKRRIHPSWLSSSAKLVC